MVPWQWIEWGLYGFAALVLLAYLGLPLMIRSMVVMRIDREQLLDVTLDELPDAEAAWVVEVETDLATQGFISLGGGILQQIATNTDSVFFIFAHLDQRTLAMATFIDSKIVTPDRQKIDRKRYVEFSTRLVDGRELNTSDHDSPDPPDHLPEKITRRYPHLHDRATLWQLHLAALDHEMPNASLKPIPLDRSWEDLLIEMLTQDMDRKCERGAWARVGSMYRMTLRGAYPNTWAELPPFKNWRRRRLVKQAAGWREKYLGPADFSPPQTAPNRPA